MSAQKRLSRVSDQNDVSLLYIMLEIHHSDQEPSLCLVHFLKIFMADQDGMDRNSPVSRPS